MSIQIRKNDKYFLNFIENWKRVYTISNKTERYNLATDKKRTHNDTADSHKNP